MKAMLLAAGKSTRLRPYTDRIPKPMIEIGGKPLLEHNLDLLRRHGITEAVINLHHMPEVVTGYFGDGSRLGMGLTYSYEPELLGTAGAVKEMEVKFRDAPFCVLYADNLTGCDITGMVAFHQAKGGIGTISVYECEDPTVSGIFGLDANRRVVRFVEKPPPELVFSNLANGGVYIFEPEVLDYIPAGRASDFGLDVFPDLLRKGLGLYAWPIQPIVKIDTVSIYESVQADLAAGELALP
jgi:NDP-sugar pyrophosphorylase family protein